MRIYTLVMFWIGVAGFIIRFCTMVAVKKWPRQREQSLGEYVGTAMLDFGFMVWAGIVLWMK